MATGEGVGVAHEPTPIAEFVHESAHPPVTVIRPLRGWRGLNLAELFAHRDLLYFLVWRDIKIRYKQTILGAAWALLQPLLMMVIFTLFFGRLADVPSDGIPYPLFVLAGLVPWTFFAHGVGKGSESVVEAAKIIKKVYFPRLMLPAASVFGGLLDFALAFGLLAGLMAIYHSAPTANVVWLPVFVLMAVLSALGVALWLSALNAQFRDIRHTTPFMLQAWLFATPIAYPSSLLDEAWRPLLGLNPMAGVVEGFRWALFGSSPAHPTLMAVSGAVTLALLATGALYYRRLEGQFADVV